MQPSTPNEAAYRNLASSIPRLEYYENIDYAALSVAAHSLGTAMGRANMNANDQWDATKSYPRMKKMAQIVHSQALVIAKAGRPGAQVLMHYMGGTHEEYWCHEDATDPSPILLESLIAQLALGHVEVIERRVLSQPLLIWTNVISPDVIPEVVTEAYCKCIESRLFAVAEVFRECDGPLAEDKDEGGTRSIASIIRSHTTRDMVLDMYIDATMDGDTTAAGELGTVLGGKGGNDSVKTSVVFNKAIYWRIINLLRNVLDENPTVAIYSLRRLVKLAPKAFYHAKDPNTEFGFSVENDGVSRWMKIIDDQIRMIMMTEDTAPLGHRLISASGGTIATVHNILSIILPLQLPKGAISLLLGMLDAIIEEATADGPSRCQDSRKILGIHKLREYTKSFQDQDGDQWQIPLHMPYGNGGILLGAETVDYSLIGRHDTEIDIAVDAMDRRVQAANADRPFRCGLRELDR